MPVANFSHCFNGDETLTVEGWEGGWTEGGVRRGGRGEGGGGGVGRRVEGVNFPHAVTDVDGYGKRCRLE